MLHVNPPGIQKPANIRARIYDIDNCLAEGSNNDITDEWDVDFAEMFGLPFEEARQLRIDSYISIGCSARGFYNKYAASHNLPDDFVDRFYADSAPGSGARFVSRHKPSSRLAELFELDYQRGIVSMVLTQGHPDHYGPILPAVGLKPHHVRQEHYIDRVNNPHDKREPDIWIYALQLLAEAIPGLSPHEVVVYEDTPQNLIHPAALGMHTVLIGDRDPGSAASSIHYRFPNILEAKEAF